jgi:GT2 family glycosyltransferase
MTDLSIIIVNYRGWKHLKACLDSLVNFKGSIYNYEFIIVDNNSDDGLLGKFKSGYPDFIFLESKVNGGFAHGCNLGAKNANGEFFLFLNPDTVAIEPEVEKLLKRAKENPEYFITSCSQVNENGKESKAFGLFPGFGTLTGTGRAFYKILNKKSVADRTIAKNNVIKPDWVSGSVIMMNRKTFEQINGFDEDFWMYFEDTDLCKRVRNAGGDIAYFTDIKIQHDHGGSSRVNLKTTSLTKTEVLISNHLYISKHSMGLSRLILHKLLILKNLIGGFPMALIGLLLFSFPKMFARTIIYGRMIGYYFGAIMRGSWISPRSVNFKRKNNL